MTSLQEPGGRPGWILRLFNQEGWNVKLEMQEFIDLRELSQVLEFNTLTRNPGDSGTNLLLRVALGILEKREG